MSGNSRRFACSWFLKKKCWQPFVERLSHQHRVIVAGTTKLCGTALYWRLLNQAFFTLISLNLIMDYSTFQVGQVYYRNSACKGLKFHICSLLSNWFKPCTEQAIPPLTCQFKLVCWSQDFPWLWVWDLGGWGRVKNVHHIWLHLNFILKPLRAGKYM